MSLLFVFLVGFLAGALACRWVRNRRFDQQVGKILQDQSRAPFQAQDLSMAGPKSLAMVNRLVEKTASLEKAQRQARLQQEDLVTGLAHDFRTPLTAILGYARMAQEEEDPKKRDRYLSIVLSRGEALNRLIEEFYLSSLLETGKEPLHLEEIDLLAYLRNLLSVWEEPLRSHFPKLDLFLSQGSFFLVTDGDLVRRILDNLLNNALQHGRAFFSLRAEVRGAGDGDSGSSLVLTLENGADLAGLEVDRLFEKAYRGQTDHRTGPGGFGLYNARTMAKRLGFGLEVQAREEGLAFVLRMPKEEGAL